METTASMNMINVEVAYARPDCQRIIALHVPVGTTVQEAIISSGMLAFFPEIDLTVQKTGIFSAVVSSSTVLKNGDRIEIYRPLQMSPMEARRRRAAASSSKRK